VEEAAAEEDTDEEERRLTSLCCASLRVQVSVTRAFVSSAQNICLILSHTSMVGRNPSKWWQMAFFQVYAQRVWRGRVRSVLQRYDGIDS